MRNKILLLAVVFFSFWTSVRADEQNRVIVCDNGLEMFNWDLDFVREAQHSIEISACFLGGDIARMLLSALEKRLEEVSGLQVYLLTTPILLEKPDLAAIERLSTRFPNNFHLQFATSVPIVLPDVSAIDNHVKMFIVDECYFSIGGTNLDETQCSEGTWTPPKKHNKILSAVVKNLPSGMRDQDVVGRGPLAKELRLAFFKYFALWEHYNKSQRLEREPEKFKSLYYYPVSEHGYVERFELSDRLRDVSPHQVKLICGGPHQSPNEITKEYVRLISEAKEEIVIANLYFCPVKPVFDALLAAVNRGVKLTVLTNGITEITPAYTKFFGWANRIHYVPVFYGTTFNFWDSWNASNKKLKATRIFEYNVKDIMLHKKMMIVDGKKCVVGSYNLGRKSDMGDYEAIISIQSELIAQDLKKVFEKDLQHSREITPEEARNWYFDPVITYLGEMQKRFHGFL